MVVCAGAAVRDGAQRGEVTEPSGGGGGGWGFGLGFIARFAREAGLFGLGFEQGYSLRPKINAIIEFEICHIKNAILTNQSQKTSHSRMFSHRRQVHI
jgi:hypothetical protein